MLDGSGNKLVGSGATDASPSAVRKLMDKFPLFRRSTSDSTKDDGAKKKTHALRKGMVTGGLTAAGIGGLYYMTGTSMDTMDMTAMAASAALFASASALKEKGHGGAAMAASMAGLLSTAIAIDHPLRHMTGDSKEYNTSPSLSMFGMDKPPAIGVNVMDNLTGDWSDKVGLQPKPAKKLGSFDLGK